MKKAILFLSFTILVFLVSCGELSSVTTTLTLPDTSSSITSESETTSNEVVTSTTTLPVTTTSTTTTTSPTTTTTTTTTTTWGHTTVTTEENTSGVDATLLLRSVNYDVSILDIFEPSLLTTQTSTSWEDSTQALSYSDLIPSRRSILDPNTVDIVSFEATIFDQLDESVMQYSTNFNSLQYLISSMTDFVDNVTLSIETQEIEENVWSSFYYGELLYYYDQTTNQVIIYTDNVDGSRYNIYVKTNDLGQESFNIYAYTPNTILFGEEMDLYQSFEYIEDEKYQYIQYYPEFIDQSVLFSAYQNETCWEMFSFVYTSMKYLIIEDSMIYELLPVWSNNVNVQAYAYSNTSFLAGYIDTLVGDIKKEVWLEMKEFSGWEKIDFNKNDLMITNIPSEEGKEDPVFNWNTFGNGNLMNDVDLYTTSGVISTGDIYEDKIMFAGADAYQFYTLVEEELTLIQVKASTHFLLIDNEYTGVATPEDFTDYLSELGITMSDYDLVQLLNTLLTSADNIDQLISDFSLSLYGSSITNYDEMQTVFLLMMQTSYDMFAPQE